MLCCPIARRVSILPLQPLTHTKLLQVENDNDPINSRSSPTLHFVLVREAIPHGYTSQYGGKDNGKFHANFKSLGGAFAIILSIWHDKH